MENHSLIKSCLFCLVLLLLIPTLAWSMQVVGVPDGDTILVELENRSFKITLYGIDAPEVQQAFGQQAKKFTAEMIAGKDVEIEKIVENTADQAAAIVRLGGKNLNEELIRSGYAWVDVGSCDRPFCQQWLAFEEEAKRDHRGLWQDKNPVPPWEWRKNAPKNYIANFLKYIWTILSLRGTH
jgi:endonuclease YncB( thermonuclease family)